jgi:hypothetical protein
LSFTTNRRGLCTAIAKMASHLVRYLLGSILLMFKP